MERFPAYDCDKIAELRWSQAEAMLDYIAANPVQRVMIVEPKT